MSIRKKWWLVPIITVLLLLSLIIVLSQGSALAPFIYAIFWSLEKSRWTTEVIIQVLIEVIEYKASLQPIFSFSPLNAREELRSDVFYAKVFEPRRSADRCQDWCRYDTLQLPWSLVWVEISEIFPAACSVLSTHRQPCTYRSNRIPGRPQVCKVLCTVPCLLLLRSAQRDPWIVSRDRGKVSSSAPALLARNVPERSSGILTHYPWPASW